MAQRIEISARDIAAIAKAIGYRKRNAVIVVSDKVTFSGLNWSGGSRTEYTAFSLATGETSAPNLSRNPPWSNPFEGATVEIPAGFIVAEHGTFCGKPSTLRVHVRPDNLAKLLPDNSV